MATTARWLVSVTGFLKSLMVLIRLASGVDQVVLELESAAVVGGQALLDLVEHAGGIAVGESVIAFQAASRSQLVDW